MDVEELEAVVVQIAALVRDRRYELALSLTEALERRLADIPVADRNVPPAVRELVAASRQLTESLLALRSFQLH